MEQIPNVQEYVENVAIRLHDSFSYLDEQYRETGFLSKSGGTQFWEIVLTICELDMTLRDHSPRMVDIYERVMQEWLAQMGWRLDWEFTGRSDSLGRPIYNIHYAMPNTKKILTVTIPVLL